MLGSTHSPRPRPRRSEPNRLIAAPVKGEAEYYSPFCYRSAFGCVAVVAGCRWGGLGWLGLAFDVGEVADAVDEGPVFVGRDRTGLDVDGSGPLGFEGALVAFEAALQGGFVEVLETLGQGGDFVVESDPCLNGLNEGGAGCGAEGLAGAGRGVEVHGQGRPFGEGLHALGQVGELLTDLPPGDEVLHRPCLLCRFRWPYRWRGVQ